MTTTAAPTATTLPPDDGHPRRVAVDGGGEVLTFLETAEETGGARTRVAVELAPGSGTPPHTHTTYLERFDILEGTLTVEVDGRSQELRTGAVAEVPIGVVHRFVNASGRPVRFRVTLEPASRGFEEMQQIGAGLAAEGAVRGHLPKDLRHLGLLLRSSDIRLAGRLRLLTPVLWVAAAIGRRQGVDRRLRERYVRW